MLLTLAARTLSIFEDLLWIEVQLQVQSIKKITIIHIVFVFTCLRLYLSD